MGELKVRELKAPLYVGEGGVFTEGAASASVVALEQCKGYTLAKRDCAALVRSGNAALKHIERDMLIRALEREIQRCDPYMFGEVRNEGLFMSKILESAERTYSSEALQFVLAVEEIKKLVGGDKTADDLRTVQKRVFEDVESPFRVAVEIAFDARASTPRRRGAVAKTPRGAAATTPPPRRRRVPDRFPVGRPTVVRAGRSTRRISREKRPSTGTSA